MYVVILGVLIASVGWLLLAARKGRLPSGIPSPRGWPFFGHVFLVDPERPHLTFQRWSKECGGIYTLQLFREQVLVLSSLDTLLEALVKKGKDFAGRPQGYYRLRVISDDFRDLLSSSPGPLWTYVRKTVHKEMRLYDSEKGKERFEAISGDVLDDLIEDVAYHKGHAFDPKPAVYKAVLNIMAVLMVGKKYSPEEEEFKLLLRIEELVKSTLAVGGSGAILDAFPWLRFLGNKTYKDLQEMKRAGIILNQKFNESIQEHFKAGEFSLGISHVITKAHQDQLAQGSLMMDDVMLKNVINNLFVGGTATTVNTLTAFLNFMIHYPEVQRCLRQEVDRIIGREQRPCLQDRLRMPYTRACILELLRITTILPMAVPHKTLTHTSIAGHTIPKGTQVFINLWALHHDEDFWGDPSQFRPERYLDTSSGDLLPGDHPVRKHTLAFGSGPRVCLGENLANSRLFLFITTILQKFYIEADYTKPLTPCDPDSFIMGIVLSSQPFTVRMVPRDVTTN